MAPEQAFRDFRQRIEFYKVRRLAETSRLDTPRFARAAIPHLTHRLASPSAPAADDSVCLSAYSPQSVYEPMDEEDLSWIKLINCGTRVEINNIHGERPAAAAASQRSVAVL